jgi:hypothetical protein
MCQACCDMGADVFQTCCDVGADVQCRSVSLACEPAGAVTMAVVPVVRGTPRADVGVDYPQLPFPLELVALCMMRVLDRRNHEGKLDASE